MKDKGRNKNSHSSEMVCFHWTSEQQPKGPGRYLVKVSEVSDLGTSQYLTICNFIQYQDGLDWDRERPNSFTVLSWSDLSTGQNYTMRET